MKLLTKTITVAFLVFLSAILLSAQDKPKLTSKIGGTIQAMVSYAQTGSDTAQVGVGLRRVRLKTNFSYGNVTAFVQGDVTNGFKLFDARMTYKFSNAVNIRVGRFIGAGVRAGGHTSHTRIDIVERPMSAQMWSKSALGVGDYRDYGVAFMGKAGEFGYNLTLGNGNGKVNLLASQRAQAKTLNQTVSISGMVNYKPKAIKSLEVGGYYGMGNTNLNEYASYNAYLYWEPKPIRLKAEVIGVTDKNGVADVSSLGYYVFGAFGFADNWEVLARYENYDPTDLTNVKDAQTLITIGARYALFPSKVSASKITFAYVVHGEEDTAIDNDVFYVMFQTAF